MVDGITQFRIKFIANFAVPHGGAIYIKDETYLSICNSVLSSYHKIQRELFFQVMYDFNGGQAKNKT